MMNQFKKIFPIFLFIAGITGAISQINILEKRIPVDFNNIRLIDAINILNKKLNHVFSFKNEIFPKDRRIKLKVSTMTLREILNTILPEGKIKYFQYGNQIIFQKINNNSEEILHDTEESDFIEKTEKYEIAAVTFQKLENLPEMRKHVIISYKTSTKRGFDSQLVNSKEEDNTFLEYQRAINEEAALNEYVPASRHNIFINIGSKSNSSATVDLLSFTAQSGISVSINYGYLLSEDWMINFQAGVIGGNTSVSLTDISASAIINISSGLRYYPEMFKFSSFAKTFIGVNAGIYSLLTSSSTTIFDSQNKSETVFGLQISGGVDCAVFEWLKIGPCISYHAINDFTINTSLSNYSGMVYSLNFGIAI